MTTRYHLPEGAQSVSANGREYVGDEKGILDLSTASADTIALLVQHAGIRQERTQEDLDREKADAEEAERFRLAVAAAVMQIGAKATAVVTETQNAVDADAGAVGEDRETAAAEAAAREAAVAAAPVTEQDGADDDTEQPELPADSRAVIPPPKPRAKKA